MWKTKHYLALYSDVWWQGIITQVCMYIMKFKTHLFSMSLFILSQSLYLEMIVHKYVLKIIYIKGKLFSAAIFTNDYIIHRYWWTKYGQRKDWNGNNTAQICFKFNFHLDKIIYLYLVLKFTSIFSWPNNEHDTSFNYKYHDDI